MPCLFESSEHRKIPVKVVGGNAIEMLQHFFQSAISIKPLSFMGGIDVRALYSNDRAQIDEELEKKLPIAKQGFNYILHSDHSIPKTVEYDTYRYFIQKGMELGSYEIQGIHKKYSRRVNWMEVCCHTANPPAAAMYLQVSIVYHAAKKRSARVLVHSRRKTSIRNISIDFQPEEKYNGKWKGMLFHVHMKCISCQKMRAAAPCCI